MPAGDHAEPPEVDFVLDADADAGADEDLPQAERREWVPPRARRPLAALAVLALAGVVVVRVAAGGSGSGPAAHASPSAHPTASATEAAPPTPGSTPQLSFAPVGGPQISVRHDETQVILIPAAGVAGLPQPGPACGRTVVCRTSTAVPRAVLRALRARYSGATVDSATSVLSGPSPSRLRLRTRTVVAHDAVETVDIVIRPMLATDTTQIGASASGSGSAVRVTLADQGWTVTVMTRNPVAIDPDTGPPSRLATDPRLLAAH